MKKNFFYAFMATVMSICSFGFVSCDDDDDNDKGKILKFKPEKVEVASGKTATVAIEGGIAPFVAISTDSKVATASVSGSTITVTGVKNGNALIKVTDKNKFTGRFAVTVKDTPANTLSVDKTSVNVGVKKIETVTVNNGIAPYTATSRDTKIVTVSVEGNKISISGVKTGKTTVTITDKAKNSVTINVAVK